MKKIIYISIFFSLIVLTYCYINRRSHFFGHFGNFNDIEIVTNGVIDQNKLVVKLVTEKEYPIDTIYNKGIKYTIPEEYGPNKIVVKYKDSISCMFVHWKTNCNDDHLYKLTFAKVDSNIFCIFNLIGHYTIGDTIRLNKIPIK